MSERVIATDEPCIVKTKSMMEGVEGILSLAQGVVFWSPPERAIKAATEACSTPLANSYGPAQGMPALRQALIEKLADENDLRDVRFAYFVSMSIDNPPKQDHRPGCMWPHHNATSCKASLAADAA